MQSRGPQLVNLTFDVAYARATEQVVVGSLPVQHDAGPDVLLIGGLGDTVESWRLQLDGLADRYRLTAFDNRGAGRTPMPEGPVSVEGMADEAAAVLRALGIPSAHVAGFSGGSIIARSWRSGTRTSSAASCYRAPGPCRTATCAHRRLTVCDNRSASLSALASRLLARLLAGDQHSAA